jgi:hypothetical protein
MDLLGNSHDLIKILSWHLPAVTEENHEKPHSEQPDLDQALLNETLDCYSLFNLPGISERSNFWQKTDYPEILYGFPQSLE